MLGYKAVKEFLDFNKINYSSGHVYNKEFHIQYYVGNKLRHQGPEIVNFQVQHPEFGQDVQIPDMDSDIYHTGFTPKYQEYSFDPKNNIFYVEHNNTKNKFGLPYKIKIHG